MKDIKSNLFSLTDGGKSIFIDQLGYSESHFAKKKFSERTEEKAPSAHFHQFEDGTWCFKDFGTSDKAIDAIVMYADRYGKTYREAMYALAAKYGINTEQHSYTKKAKVIVGEPTEDVKEHGYAYILKDRFTKAELRFLGPLVTQDICDALNYASVVSHSFLTSEGKMITIHSDEYNMFFRRKCSKTDENGNVVGTFYKNYQPHSENESYKFTYAPKGMSPGEVLHGEAELAKVYTSYNDEQRCKFESNPANRGKSYQEQKLPCAVIVSGERDALCTLAFGEHPVWLNSETQTLTKAKLDRIKKYVWKIYYIPDCDETGLKEGRKNAFVFPELYTVWLPANELSQRVGDQGKACKDLRDWTELHPNGTEFRSLLNRACAMKFWEVHANGKVNVSSTNLQYFLYMYGFCKIKNPYTNQTQLVHIVDYGIDTDKHIVERISEQDVRDFILKWLNEADLSRKVKDAIRDDKRTGSKIAQDLPVLNLCFDSCTKNSQTFTFPNASYRVTADGITALKEHEKNYVFANKVVQHEVELLDPMFTFDYNPETKDFEFEILNCDSKLLTVYLHQSMLHGTTDSDATLSDEQLLENKLNFQSTVFNIGFITHDYKEPSQQWLLLHLDNRQSDSADEANGRNGKSFTRQVLTKVCGKEIVDVKVNKTGALDYQHLFGSVSLTTDIIYIDETPKRFSFDKLKEEVSTGINVNPKGRDEYHIPHDESPKILANSNYAPENNGSSSEGRNLYWLAGDYYHEKTPDNGYTETRKIRDDFNMTLFDSDYSEEDWNRDINFIMQCEQFYLYVCSTYGDKIIPPMGNMRKRMTLSTIPEYFTTYLKGFFGPVDIFRG